MIYEEKTPDPNTLGSGDAPEEGVEEIPMEDIAAFMRQLNEESPEADELVAQFNRAKTIIEAAAEMNNLGPTADTPLAKLLGNEVISSAMIAVMMAPQFSDFEKIQYIGAIVLVSCKEYGIEV